MKLRNSAAWMTPALWLCSGASAQPANDTCGTAQTVGVGTYGFDTTGARAEGDACNGWAPSVWYRHAAPAVPGKHEVLMRACPTAPGVISTIAIFAGCGGVPLTCFDGCPGTSAIVDAGQEVAAMVSTLRQFPFPGGATSPGSLTVASVPVQPWAEVADGGGDAGALPEFAQVVSGSGPMDRLIGRIDTQSDTDVYRIRICDPAAFSVTGVRSETFGGSPLGTLLALFDADGHGITFNDDAAENVDQSTITSRFVTAGGIYYLAVSSDGRYPASGGQRIWNSTLNHTGEFRPNGPGAAGVFDGWVELGGGPSDYRLALTGACFVSDAPPCTADFNTSGAVDVADIFAFLSAWFSQGAGSDFDSSGAADVGDIFAFLSAWFAGC